MDFDQYGDEVTLTARGYRACDLARSGLAYPGPLSQAVADELGSGATEREGELFLLSSVVILCPELVGPAS